MSEVFYKKTFTFWTEYPPEGVELVDLAHEATGGDAIATGGLTVVVEKKDLPDFVASFFSLEI